MTIAMGRLEIETPDHVVLRFQLAGAGNRGFAAITDFVIVFAFTFAMGYGYGQLEPLEPSLVGWENWVVLFELFLAWLYFVLLEWLWNGQTIGKRLFGLRVISEDGEPARFVAVIVRNLVRVVDFLPFFYGFGLVTLIISSRSQRLGDYAGGTFVVRAPRPRRDRSAPVAALPAVSVSSPPERASVAKRDLVVTGMTCASCVASVEDALRGVAGVRAADVNLATERARVEIDPGRADDAALVRAIERAGYGALVLAADRAERAATEERERAMRRTYLRTLRRRLVVAAAFAVPTLLLSMADLLYPDLMKAAWRPYVLFALATPVQLWSALPFYRGALSAARHRRTDMNTLVVVGTTTAYAVSVLATLFGRAFAAVGLEPSRFHYYDTATVIVTLVLAGRYLEARARARTADEVRALATLGAKSARVRRPGGAEEDVPIDSLAVGDVV